MAGDLVPHLKDPERFGECVQADKYKKKNKIVKSIL